MNERAVILFSGGQDSTTCLGWARNRYDCQAIVFDYGQRHHIEIIQAEKIAALLNVPLTRLDIPNYAHIVDSALLDQGDVSAPHGRQSHLPAAYVPNRNALFLTLAHAFAQHVDAGVLVGGMCQTDFSGYPDCRRDFIDAMALALNMGSEVDIRIETPLMDIDKAQTFALAEAEGVLDLVLRESHTCYNGLRTPHEWGGGCNACPACRLRARGWEKYKETRHA